MNITLSNNEIIYTSDNWKTAETAIGKQKYTLNGITYEEYCVNTKLLLSGKVISGDIYSLNYATDENGVVTSGTHIDLNNGDFVFAGGKLSYLNDKLSINGNIIAKSGEIGKWKITSEENGGAIYRDFEQYRAWIQPPTSAVTWVYSCQEKKNNKYYGNWYVRSDGYMYAGNADINGSLKTNGRTSLFEDKQGFYVGNDGFDLCWLGRDEWRDDTDVFAHLRATSKAFEIIVGNTIVLSVPISSRFSGTSIGYHVETSTLCSEKICYSNALIKADAK